MKKDGFRDVTSVFPEFSTFIPSLTGVLGEYGIHGKDSTLWDAQGALCALSVSLKKRKRKTMTRIIQIAKIFKIAAVKETLV